MATRTPGTLPTEAEFSEDVYVFPASFAQERLWFLDRLDPGSPLYNTFAAFRVEGELDHVALTTSVNEIVRRHEVLRTTFASFQGRPMQVVATAATVPIPVVDLRPFPESQRPEEAHRLALEETLRPFDLEKGPLLRVRLFRTAERSHLLLLTVHHIAFDAWSMDVFFRELATLYPAFQSGSSPRLPDLPIQYADFAEWQRQWLAGEVLEKQRSYWKRQLAEAPAFLELPADRARPPVLSARGGRHTIVLPKALAQKLRAFSRHEGATLFMTLLAAFQALLGRLTQKEDFLLGTLIAGRGRPETEDLIGFFVNTLVLRGDLSGNPTFRELLGRVQDRALEAHAHQDLPFEKLVEELRPDRSLGHTPLFQVTFGFQDLSREIRQIPGLTLFPVEISRPLSHYELSLDVLEREEDLACLFSYSTDLFDLSTILRLADHLRHLLEAIVTNPDQPIWTLPLVSPAERHQLLIEWNQTDAPVAPQVSMDQLFEEQVARDPASVAAMQGTERWTYRELNARANQLAHYLRRLGVRPEDRVGIFLERSLEMLVGLLGVLKAGAGYVPLDTAYPKERLAFLLEDSGAAVVLTREELAGALPERTRIVRLDSDRDVISRESEENPGAGAGLDNLAYVIYTSGSTGRPKGVEILHRSLVNYVTAVSKLYRTGPSDRVLQFSSPNFDSAADEIFIPLARGATVVLRSDEMLESASIFLERCREWETTILVFPTSYWHELVAEMAAHQLRFPETVRLVSIGGERVLPERFLQWREVAQDRIRLWNGYGPTETTICATFCDLTEQSAGNPSPTAVPIGKPISNVRVYVLGRRGELQPIGVPGELYIAGAGLARGYRNLTEETDRAFVASPLPENRGERLYRTGDLVRFRPDGNLEFLGRRDDQVKVRGFRIELGEIEAVLAQNPSIAESVVVAREDGTGEKRLIAYVVGRGRTAPAIPELRSFLKRKMPDYMVPSAFVVLEELPKTPTGKLDRRALPEPGESMSRETAFVAPRNPIEDLLGAIWGDVLKLEAVGIEDDFFSLGGHSLIATQVISRVREAFGVELPLRAIFETPTIAGLAERIVSAKNGDAGSPPPPLVPVPRSEDLPLSFAQQRLWFLHQLEPDSAAYNLPIALRLKGPLNVAALADSLHEIWRRHETLRTVFAVREGRPVQVIRPPGPFSLTQVDLRGASEPATEASRLVSVEAHRPFDLSEGPLFRSAVWCLAEDDHILVLTMHHIVSDGWSVGILRKELTRLYAAFREGGLSSLPRLPIQYADYALWQRGWMRGEVLDRQLSYWKKQLEGIPAALDLPTDHPRPPSQSFRGSSESLELPAALLSDLTALARQEQATLYMVLLAAFAALLSRYTGQEDIPVGTPIAGRTHVETEGLIGFFVNTLVLRGDLSGDPSFRQLLARVRECALGAYTHQELPFEKLVEELRPDRSTNRTPLFQVTLQLAAEPESRLALPNLETEDFPIEGGIAKFDLSLFASTADGRLSCSLGYATDLFERETIRRMLGHFQVLLQAMVESPERRVSQTPLLTEPERQQLRAWNRTDADYGPIDTIHALFEAQVQRTPEAVALEFEGESVNYSDLNRRANRLARHLQSLGFGPESLVGVFLERSPDMVVALLAILKAGGAYVPLDPEYPANRIGAILQDAVPLLVLTQQKLLPQLSAHSVRTICLDSNEEFAGGSDQNPESAASGENLAYTIYTSGSTGMPKGAQNTHRAVANRLLWMQSTYRLDATDRVVQKTPFSFDVSVWEFFWPLLAGARMVIAKPGGHRDSAYLAGLIASAGITTIHFVPSMLRAFIEDGGFRNASSLRRVFCSGEALSLELQERFFAACPAELHNLYGPTEAAVDVTSWACRRGETDRHSVPIGHPIGNTRIHLLDRHGQEVPIGVAGELCIGGIATGRGYLNRPVLTAERFVPDPFSGEGGRLYRTGDLARYLRDGAIEYLGRLDHQVKIRGVRIEPAEVESALMSHPAVEQAVVVAREHGPDDRRLVAYLVGRREAIPDISGLRSLLKQALPDAMVPSTFVILDALPLTSTGKVDRKALLHLDVRLPESEHAAAPHDTLELVLVKIWEEVLKVRPIGVADNFFELGGHSLLAVPLFAKIEKAFGRNLPLATLFEAPTVEQLAGKLRQEGWRAPWSSLVVIQGGNDRPPFFCVPGVGGNILGFHDLARALGPEQAVYGLQAQGLDGKQEPLTRIEDMAAHYIREIQSVLPEGPFLLGGASFGGSVAYEMARQLEIQGRSVTLLALFDAFAPRGDHSSPWLSVIRHRLQRYGERLAHHGRSLLFQGQRASYIRARSRTLRRRIRSRIWQILYKLYRSRSRPLPPALHNVREAGYLANRQYVAKPYGGRVTLFRTSPRSAADAARLDMGWGELARGGVEILLVAGDHVDMLFKPQVKSLAEQLRRSIESAIGEEPKARPGQRAESTPA